MKYITLSFSDPTAKPEADLKWVHALQAGTWPSMAGPVTITEDDLTAIANSYNTAAHEAPVVLGHPETDDPARGWVHRVELRENGLWLGVELMPEMEQLVEQKRYRKVSVSLYQPGAPGNPVPAGYYLKHLGFLGAVPPAVKGLTGIELSEDETITINFQESETPMKTQNGGTAPQAETAPVQVSETQLSERAQTLELREQAIAQRERVMKREAYSLKLEPHVQSGRLLPTQKRLFIELMERADSVSVSFGEGEAPKPLADELMAFLAAMPAQVTLSEVAAAAPANAAAVSFSAPAGYSVDAEMLALDRKAQAWLAEHPNQTYVDAIAAVQAQ